HGQALLRESGVLVLLEQFVVADDPNPVPRGHTGGVSNRLVDSSRRLLAEGLRVSTEVFLVFAEDPRREPEFADLHALQELAKAAAMVLVRMGQDERGEVRLAVDLRQQLHQPIDDGCPRVFIFVGTFEVVEVHLHDGLFVDRHRRGVSRSDRPERETALRQTEILATLAHDLRSPAAPGAEPAEHQLASTGGSAYKLTCARKPYVYTCKPDYTDIPVSRQALSCPLRLPFIQK